MPGPVAWVWMFCHNGKSNTGVYCENLVCDHSSCTAKVLLPSKEVAGKWRGSSENPHLFWQQDLLILENIAFYSDLPFPVNATWIWTWKIYDAFLDQYKPAQKHIIYTLTKKLRKYKLHISAAEQGIINMLWRWSLILLWSDPAFWDIKKRSQNMLKSARILV